MKVAVREVCLREAICGTSSWYVVLLGALVVVVVVVVLYDPSFLDTENGRRVGRSCEVLCVVVELSTSPEDGDDVETS